MKYTDTTGSAMIQQLEQVLRVVEGTLVYSGQDNNVVTMDTTEEYVYATVDVVSSKNSMLLDIHYSLTDDCGLLTLTVSEWDTDTCQMEPSFPRIMTVEQLADWFTENIQEWVQE